MASEPTDTDLLNFLESLLKKDTENIHVQCDGYVLHYQTQNLREVLKYLDREKIVRPGNSIIIGDM